MSKLKLKSKKNLTRTGRKSEKLKDNYSKSGQSQSKLFQFFDSNLETTIEREEEEEGLSLNFPEHQIDSTTTSKYFTNNENFMSSCTEDASFTDFKPEKSKKIPKVLPERKKKTKTATQKPRLKNDDLRQYTDKFEKVCSAGGIDVNPEHLQLAIAMSLSLKDHRDEMNCESKESSQSGTSEASTSQGYYDNEEEKVKRIKKTLQEYGFKVPVGPICTNPIVKRRRPRNYDKYLLLTRTVEEKKQIVSNVISQIMFEEQINKTFNNSDVCNNECELHSSILSDVWCRDCCAFSKKSLPFNSMSEEFDVFYVTNLITSSDSKVGCLLKDWSKIPGRSPSPERVKESLDFRETSLFVEEFDALLSSQCSYLKDRIEILKHKSPNPKKCNDSLRVDKCSDEIVVVKSRSCSPELFGDNSYYGEDYTFAASNIKPIDEINNSDKGPTQVSESSNDSLPDVYISQMSQPKCLKSPVLDTLNEEVICVEEYGEQSFQRSLKNLSQCSIDLTHKEFDTDDEKFGKEALFIDETTSETSIEDSKNMSENVREICRSPLLDTDVNKEQNDVIDGLINNVESVEKGDVSVKQNDSECVVKRKLVSLGSLEDTMRFEEALKEYELQKPVIENTSSTSESFDLTNEEYKDIEMSQKFSQMYKNDNGVLHFESYHETDGVVDITDIASPVRNHVTQSKSNVYNMSDNIVNKDENFKRKGASCNVDISINKNGKNLNGNISNMSADIFDDDNSDFANGSILLLQNKNLKPKNVHNLSDSLLSHDSDIESNVHGEDLIVNNECNEFETHIMSSKDNYEFFEDERISRSLTKKLDINGLNNTINNSINLENIKKVSCKSEIEKEIDLTQSPKESDNKILENDFVNDRQSINNINLYADSRSPKKSANNSDEVFIISDEEFNYSVNASMRTKENKKDRFTINAISDSDDDLEASNNKDDQNIFDDFDRNKLRSDDYKVPNDFDLYGSSIFDQIPSYHLSRISSVSQRKSAEMDFRKSEVVNSTLNELSNSVVPGCSYDKNSDDFIDKKWIETPNSKDNGHVMTNVRNSELTTSNTKNSSTLNMKNKHSKIENETNEMKGNLDRGSPVVLGISEIVKNLENTDDTPKSDKFIVKVDNLTPAQDYNSMNTPQVHKELSKFGLKPLKRKRAVQILEHIYNQTHPVVESKDLEAKIKKRKLVKSFQNTSSPIRKTTKEQNTADKIQTNNIEVENFHSKCKDDDNLLKEIQVNLVKESGVDVVPCGSSAGNEISSVGIIYKADKLNVVIKQTDCDTEELYFQTREKSKIHGCRIPLHVAFHNYVSVRSRLQQAILTYHPINIDAVHKGLVADGYRYNPKDLFQFMDKKCITIKTTDKNGGTRQKKR